MTHRADHSNFRQYTAGIPSQASVSTVAIQMLLVLLGQTVPISLVQPRPTSLILMRLALLLMVLRRLAERLRLKRVNLLSPSAVFLEWWWLSCSLVEHRHRSDPAHS
jgi:hypothetical protein